MMALWVNGTCVEEGRATWRLPCCAAQSTLADLNRLYTRCQHWLSLEAPLARRVASITGGTVALSGLNVTNGYNTGNVRLRPHSAA